MAKKKADDLRYYMLVPIGHYCVGDADDSEVDPLLVAAPNLAAAEAYVIREKLYRHLDPAYDVIPRQFVHGYGRRPKAAVTLDVMGYPYNEAESLFVKNALMEAGRANIVRAKGPDNSLVRVLNPGDFNGRTWLFLYRVAEDEYDSVIIEARSPEHAVAEFDTHPLSYAVRLNPFRPEASKYAVDLVAGAIVPETKYRVKADTWLTYDGTLIADPKDIFVFNTPDISPSGRPWLRDCWKITGVEGRDQPYETDYLLPNGNYVNPLLFAKPPSCTVCDADARDHLTSKTCPGEVYCSEHCRDRATAAYMLVVPGKGKRRGSKAYGPVTGWTAASAVAIRLCEQVLHMDADAIDLVRHEPLPDEVK